ncbi:hypothetical protein RJ640_007497 [Escallonia rubra]|uniref:Aminotransferase class V domain-containing protein n=1 Tax=Escallonia rubra TaxID=112253 RepID=A0AA88UA93_9ASTE|nr:hypothetical protein RJ640_007497 [Escallonia rubra]
MLKQILKGQKVEQSGHSTMNSPGPFTSESPHGLARGMDSFQMLEKGLARNDSAEKKLSWIRSEIIGSDAEIETPFGSRRLTYADHTASGRCLHYIENYLINHVLPFYGTTAAIKRLQEVMGIAIPSILRQRVLKCLTNEERWVVFVGPFEHHSNILSWRQSLAEVVEIGLDDNGLLDMVALRHQLEYYQYSNRPLLGSFAACSNVTGIYSDTRALTRLLHHYGGFACFDFATSGPYVEIDMRSGAIDGYDAVFLSPHKFLGGPGSPGILLMNKALYRLKSSPPSTCGGGTINFVNGFDEKASDTLYVEDIEEREDAGTPQILNKIRAALAFWMKDYISYKFIETKEHNYIIKAVERLIPNPNILVLGNTTTERQAILSFLVYTTTHSTSNSDGRETGAVYQWRETGGNKRHKPLHGPFVAKLLNDLFGIQARGGCACAGPYGHSLLNVDETRSLAYRSAIKMGYNGVKPGWTRVSFSYYMSNEEFEFILSALEFTAIYGHRFLTLYHMNWKTGAWTLRREAFKELKMLATTRELNRSEEQSTSETKDAQMISTYTSYLETAKHIASLLPKIPSQGRVPKDIDRNLVQFRV